jgi:hypothetical protein
LKIFSSLSKEIGQSLSEAEIRLSMGVLVEPIFVLCLGTNVMQPMRLVHTFLIGPFDGENVATRGI